MHHPTKTYQQHHEIKCCFWQVQDLINLVSLIYAVPLLQSGPIKKCHHKNKTKKSRKTSENHYTKTKVRCYGLCYAHKTVQTRKNCHFLSYLQHKSKKL